MRNIGPAGIIGEQPTELMSSQQMAVAQTERKETPDIAMLRIVAPGDNIMQTANDDMEDEQHEQKGRPDTGLPAKGYPEDAVAA